MLRTVLFHTLLLALPFLIYAAWFRFLRQKREESGGTWDDAPLTWLMISGLLLMFAGLVVTRVLSGDEIGSKYIPPRYENGEVVPAEILPSEDEVL